MKYPTRLSDAVHILAFIALYPDCDLTSNKLAESVQTNPAYVRQLMSALRKGGLLVSVKGHPHQPRLWRGCKYPTGAAGFLLRHSKNNRTKNARNYAERCAGTISHETLPFGTKILLNGKYRTSLRDYTENRRDLYPVWVFHFPEKAVSICRKSTMSQA